MWIHAREIWTDNLAHKHMQVVVDLIVVGSRHGVQDYILDETVSFALMLLGKVWIDLFFLQSGFFNLEEATSLGFRGLVVLYDISTLVGLLNAKYCSYILWRIHIAAACRHTGRGVAVDCWPETPGVKRMRPLLPSRRESEGEVG